MPLHAVVLCDGCGRTLRWECKPAVRTRAGCVLPRWEIRVEPCKGCGKAAEPEPSSAALRTRHQCAFWWGHMDDPVPEVCQDCRYVDAPDSPPPNACPLRRPA